MKPWQNLPCDIADLNALVKLMPAGWMLVEWTDVGFELDQAWGLPASLVRNLSDGEAEPTHDDALSHRVERPFDAWPLGRLCLAAWDPGTEELCLLEVDGFLVYADPDGAPEPEEFDWCPACATVLTDAEALASHDVDPPGDTCPHCGATNQLDVLRRDGVRVP